MTDAIGKLLEENNMPDTPTARAIYRKMLEQDDDNTRTYQRPWIGLTAEDWAEVADMPDSFDQGVAWAQARLKERNT